ncbi:Hypothetical protein R9X50_00342900 [Acrodontium crateriforme]|uniref:Uncharacterized protein n=1 Tax=Acrodontium crateriforme TaxID=150365 RepID=A0AAQ3R7F3_9PEZI|nr:Hypothetical protein R9X50_00342900 [Acrodontium crateriforme]
MSTSLPIPKRKQPVYNNHAAGSGWSWSSSSAASSYSRQIDSSPSSSLNKESIVASPSRADTISPRRPSLMGSSLSKSEYTVVNLAHEHGQPRLVTCVKSSQGFEWNSELFLPSYVDHDSHDLEHRPDPVQDIVLTDEEAASMLPQ